MAGVGCGGGVLKRSSSCCKSAPNGRVVRRIFQAFCPLLADALHGAPLSNFADEDCAWNFCGDFYSDLQVRDWRWYLHGIYGRFCWRRLAFGGVTCRPLAWTVSKYRNRVDPCLEFMLQDLGEIIFGSRWLRLEQRCVWHELSA